LRRRMLTCVYRLEDRPVAQADGLRHVRALEHALGLLCRQDVLGSSRSCFGSSISEAGFQSSTCECYTAIMRAGRTKTTKR
jgi:hypothetical protein